MPHQPTERNVFRRTQQGQIEALQRKLGLSDTEHGVLLSVNGYTPIETFVSLRRDGHGVIAAVSRLLELGLIEAAPVAPAAQTAQPLPRGIAAA